MDRDGVLAMQAHSNRQKASVARICARTDKTDPILEVENTGEGVCDTSIGAVRAKNWHHAVRAASALTQARTNTHINRHKHTHTTHTHTCTYTPHTRTRAHTHTHTHTRTHTHTYTHTHPPLGFNPTGILGNECADVIAKCSTENQSGHDFHINTDAHPHSFMHILASKGGKPFPGLPTRYSEHLPTRAFSRKDLHFLRSRYCRSTHARPTGFKPSVHKVLHKYQEMIKEDIVEKGINISFWKNASVKCHL